MLKMQMIQLGASESLMLGSDVHFNAVEEQQVRNQYDVQAQDTRYLSLCDQLAASQQGMQKADRHAAMKESFRLGGEAIQVLAKDPMLPEEIHPSEHRRRLWAAVIEYDKLGRNVWADKNSTPTMMPTSLSSYATSGAMNPEAHTTNPNTTPVSTKTSRLMTGKSTTSTAL